MPDIKIRKQRSPEDMLSDNAGKTFSPPTVMYDAACCAEDPDHGRNGGMGEGGSFFGSAYSSEDYQHKSRLARLTTKQGCSTLSRDAGDFDYIGGIPDRLLNGS